MNEITEGSLEMTIDEKGAIEIELKPGKTKQDYGTPWEFIEAIEKRFGPIVCDLAAHAGNAKAMPYYDEEANSLVQPWAAHHPTGTLWLNPPFEDIEPWAKKCLDESRMRHGLIVMLTPASIGTDWFAEQVNGKAHVLGIAPRIPFDGMKKNTKTGKVDGYPKDLMLSIFGYELDGFGTWRWKP